MVKHCNLLFVKGGGEVLVVTDKVKTIVCCAEGKSPESNMRGGQSSIAVSSGLPHDIDSKNFPPK
jgi:hypothetical protein